MQVRHCMCARPQLFVFIGVVYIHISCSVVYGSNQATIGLQKPRDEMVESLCVMAAGVCVYEGNQAG